MSVFCHEILHFESYCSSFSQVTQSPKTSKFVNDVQSNSAEKFRAFGGHRFKPWNTWKIPNSQIQSVSCTAQARVKAEKRRTSLTHCLHESITQESASLRKPQRYLARNALSLSTLQSIAISVISNTFQPLCSVSHHRCGNSISLQCHSQDPAGAELQILTTLFPENVYLALSPESRFLSQSSAYDQWPIISPWQSSSTLRIISPLSLPLSLFLFLAHLLSPGWKSLYAQDEKVAGSSPQKPGVHRLAMEYTCNFPQNGLWSFSACCSALGLSTNSTRCNTLFFRPR